MGFHIVKLWLIFLWWFHLIEILNWSFQKRIYEIEDLMRFITNIAIIGWFDGISFYKVMIDVFKLISSLWEIELKFSKENLWNWYVEEIDYNYSHFWQFMSLIWLLMKDYLNYEVYMISIIKLMTYMNVKVQFSHFVMILWDQWCWRAIQLIMSLCGYMLKKEELMLLGNDID